MPLPERVDAVFCDVGGPVYSDDNFTAAVLLALDEIRSAQGRTPVDRAEFARLYDDMRAAQSGGFRRTLARELLDDESLRGELHERTAAHWRHPAGTAYPDALELFRALHGHVVVGVLAKPGGRDRRRAAPGRVRRRRRRLGHQRSRRPREAEPELFAWALREAGTTAEHAVHIGNRLDTDVRPARALGLGTVWVTRGEAPDHPTPEQAAEADVTVADLTTLAPLLLARAGSPRAV